MSSAGTDALNGTTVVEDGHVSILFVVSGVAAEVRDSGTKDVLSVAAASRTIVHN